MSELIAKQREFAVLLSKLIQYGTDQGYTFRMGDCWRSSDVMSCPTCSTPVSYQMLLVASGKSKKMDSKHCDRLAADFAEIAKVDGSAMTDDDYRHLGEYWEAHGGRWGGRFGLDVGQYATKIGWDRGHVEL